MRPRGLCGLRCEGPKQPPADLTARNSCSFNQLRWGSGNVIGAVGRAAEVEIRQRILTVTLPTAVSGHPRKEANLLFVLLMSTGVIVSFSP